MALTAKLSLSVSGQQTNPADLGTPVDPFAAGLIVSFAAGTGANQADRVFKDTRTLGASATEDLDLAGALLDAFGAALIFAKIKAIYLEAAPGNANDVQLTRPATNGVPVFLAAADGIAVKPGGAFAWVVPGTGITVTAATGDLLTLTNSGAGTAVTYDIVIIGTSA